jgi:hypothetical protein
MRGVLEDEKRPVVMRPKTKRACDNWPTSKFDDSVSGFDSEAISSQADLLWWPVANSVTD